MPTIEQSGLLAGLVKGFTGEQTRQAQEELASRASQREAMLTYLGHMATAPNIPPEHQQWALQKAAELAQADVTKKLPKVDLGELPPVQQTRSGTSQTPGMTLQAPQLPAAGPQVGTAANGTVNALGATPPSNLTQPALSSVGPPPAPPSIASAPAPVALPPGPSTTVTNTQQFAPGGQPHVMSPEEMVQRGLIQPPKSPDEFTLTPGEERFSGGKVIAKNEQAKPGAKSGYEPVPGEPGMVKDNATGAVLTPDEVAKNPEAKAVADAAQKIESNKEARADEKQRRQFEQQAKMQEQAMENALKRQDHAAAVKAHDDAFKDWNDAQNRVHVMDQNLIKAKQGDQQAMLSLLTNHVGMTQGAQKGARITQAILNEAQASAPWLQKIGAKFDDRGFLSGVTLTPDQMDQMVALAHEKADIAKESYDRVGEHYADELGHGAKGKGKVSAPKPPPPEPQAAPQTLPPGWQ